MNTKNLGNIAWLFTVGILALAGCSTTAREGDSAPGSSSAAPENTEFANEEKLTIQGYTGPQQDPVLSPDGQYLFFDTHNDAHDPVKHPNYLHYAKRVDYKTFKYVGEIRGVNFAGAGQWCGSMDLAGNFYFSSTKTYPFDQLVIYKGKFNKGTVSDIKAVQGISRKILGEITMQGYVSEDGKQMYYSDCHFKIGEHIPSTCKLWLAEKRSDGSFTNASNSEELPKNVNATGTLLYNPFLSHDGLELVFTKADRSTGKLKMYISRRSSKTGVFETAKSFSGLTGDTNENGGISPDGKHIYYHKVTGVVTSQLYVISRK